MGYHERLGAESRVRVFDAELIRMLLEQV